MSRVIQHVVAMKRLDWVARHDYWDRLSRRRSWGFMSSIAEMFAPDELLHGRNIPVHRGGVIAVEPVDRRLQLTLFQVGFVRRTRRRLQRQ
jgi:hypothetical protein